MTSFHPKIQAFINHLLASGRAKTLRGCSESDILEVECKYRLKLPPAYRDFLSAAGRGADQFLVGTDWLYPQLLELGEAARDLLYQHTKFKLSDSDFVFLMHQGYQFMYFRTGTGDPDPEVRRYLEPWDAPRHTGVSLTQLLEQTLADELKVLARSHRGGAIPSPSPS
jgi:hypothetical protein